MSSHFHDLLNPKSLHSSGGFVPFASGNPRAAMRRGLGGYSPVLDSSSDEEDSDVVSPFMGLLKEQTRDVSTRVYEPSIEPSPVKNTVKSLNVAASAQVDQLYARIKESERKRQPMLPHLLHLREMRDLSSLPHRRRVSSASSVSTVTDYGAHDSTLSSASPDPCVNMQTDFYRVLQEVVEVCGVDRSNEIRKRGADYNHKQNQSRVARHLLTCPPEASETGLWKNAEDLVSTVSDAIYSEESNFGLYHSMLSMRVSYNPRQRSFSFETLSTLEPQEESREAESQESQERLEVSSQAASVQEGPQTHPRNARSLSDLQGNSLKRTIPLVSPGPSLPISPASDQAETPAASRTPIVIKPPRLRAKKLGAGHDVTIPKEWNDSIIHATLSDDLMKKKSIRSYYEGQSSESLRLQAVGSEVVSDAKNEMVSDAKNEMVSDAKPEALSETVSEVGSEAVSERRSEVKSREGSFSVETPILVKMNMDEVRLESKPDARAEVRCEVRPEASEVKPIAMGVRPATSSGVKPAVAESARPASSSSAKSAPSTSAKSSTSAKPSPSSSVKLPPPSTTKPVPSTTKPVPTTTKPSSPNDSNTPAPRKRSFVVGRPPARARSGSPKSVTQSPILEGERRTTMFIRDLSRESTIDQQMLPIECSSSSDDSMEQVSSIPYLDVDDNLMPIQEETHEVVSHSMAGAAPNMLSASSALTRSQRSLYRSSETQNSTGDRKRSGPGGSESDQTRVSLLIGDNLEPEERSRRRDSEDDDVLSDFSDLFDGVLDDIDRSNEKQCRVC